MSPSRRPVLRNAEVEPLDLDGVNSVIVGSAVWVLALVFVLVRYSHLQDTGRGWWLYSVLAGLALGVVGFVYCIRRRSRVRRGLSADPTEGLLRRNSPS
ncbi:MAG TPA: DUF2530 domain-containing protein [Actinopolymorphaceae bacterium]